MLFIHILNDLTCANLKGSTMEMGFVLLEMYTFFCRSRGGNESENQQHVTQKGDIHQNSYLPVEDYIPNQTKSQFVISIYYVRASNIH